MAANRTSISQIGIGISATLPAYAIECKSPSAPAHSSPRFCTPADITRAIGGLIVSGIVISGLLFGQMFADAYLSAGFVAVVVVALFVGLIAYIVHDIKRAFRKAQARRARIAEACGVRLSADDIEDIARVGVAFRGRDLL